MEGGEIKFMEEKISLMILDDEPAICSLIASLIQWEDLQMEFRGEAHDGVEAFRQIRENCPDIVITDIQMPGMDGLELIRNVQAEGLFPVFLIVSGYSKFEYAKQAIEYKVENYLLKPIKKAELNSLLQGIRERLNQERKEKEERKELLTRQETVTRMRWEQEIVEWLETPGRGWETLLRNVLGEDYFAGEFTHVFGGIWKGERNREDAFFSVAQDELGRALEKTGMDVSFYSWGNGCILAGKTQKAWEEEEWLDFLKETCSAVVQKNWENWTFAVTPLLPDYGGFGLAMDQAWKQACVKGKCNIVWCEPRSKRPAAAWNAERRKELSYFLESLNEDGLTDWVSQILRRNCWEEEKKPEAYGIALEVVRTAKEQMQSLCVKRAEEGIEEPDFSFWEFGSELSKTESLDGLVRLVTNTVGGMIQAVRREREQRERRSVRETKKYLQDNYAKAISLEDAARHVMLAPTYLSLLFKQETGKNYNEYLTEIRMEAAKELLSKTGMGIEEVAEQVGYTDSRYFSKLFTKKVGIRPKEYRRLYS